MEHVIAGYSSKADTGIWDSFNEIAYRPYAHIPGVDTIVGLLR